SHELFNRLVLLGAPAVAASFAEQADAHAVRPEYGDLSFGLDDTLLAVFARAALFALRLIGHPRRRTRRIFDHVVAFDHARRIVDVTFGLDDHRLVANDLPGVNHRALARALPQFLDKPVIGLCRRPVEPRRCPFGRLAVDLRIAAYR